MAEPSVHGRFIWQELMTADMVVAEKFYATLIGWRVQAPTHAGSPYGVFAADSGSVGGVMPLSEEARKMGARPHWLPYIGAEDVDETLAAAERLGGKVLRPAADIENIGRYAVLADPHGAAFGIYRPMSPSAARAKSQPQRGEFAWQELATSDYEAAFKFYGELFGWQALNRMDMGPAGTYLIFGRDQLPQGGIYKLSAQMPAPYWLGYIEVDSTEAVAAGAREAGGQVVSGPMDVPGGRIAQLLDPGGVLFAVHTIKPAAAAATSARPSRAKRSATAPTERAPAASSKAASGQKPASVTQAPAASQAKKAAQKTAAKRVVAKTAQKVVKKGAKKAAKKFVKKAAKKVAKKATKKATKKTAKKAVRKAAARSAKKSSARLVGKRPARRGLRIARGRGARRR